jgi:hypothetical protein
MSKEKMTGGEAAPCLGLTSLVTVANIATFRCLYNWYITPLSSALHQIGWPQALGVVLFVGLLKSESVASLDVTPKQSWQLLECGIGKLAVIWFVVFCLAAAR